MKKTLLLFAIVVWISLPSIAQTLLIDKPSFNLTVDTSEMAEALSTVTNNTSGQKTIKWVRYVDSQPEGWDFSICDKNNCFSSALTSTTFVLAAGEGGFMKMDVWPYGVIGQGSYHIDIFDVSDSANSKITMFVNVTGQATTGISSLKDGSISIYPNPAKDVLFVNLDVAKHITSLEIYNVVGQKVKTVNLEDGLKSVSVPVSDMKKGVYFLRVVSGTKEIVTRTFSKD
jgi:hypothetical protein